MRTNLWSLVDVSATLAVHKLSYKTNLTIKTVVINAIVMSALYYVYENALQLIQSILVIGEKSQYDVAN